MSKQKTKPIYFRTRRGFTLIEVIVGIGIFAILISAILGSYSVLSRTIKVARERTILASTAAHYLELIRNMPYGDIGTINGNPPGDLADATNPIVTNIESVNFRIYYEVTYIDDPADGTILAGTDSAPNDYKQVKLTIDNTSTNHSTNFITNVSAQGLEGLVNAGALYIRVFDAEGQPVPNANVRIENPDLTPALVLDRTTDANGNLIEVGLPASVNGYQLLVTKTGYSSDQTYPITVANPNPTKPHATIVDGLVTQISFAIDLSADLEIRTVSETCQPISGAAISVRGSKLIGTSPDVLKFMQTYTSGGSGLINMNNIEWDNYVPALEPSAPYMVYGTSPIQQVTVLPASDQTFTFVLGPQTAHSLRVIVKDSATGAPVEGANVRLIRNSPYQEYTGVTGGSVWQQIDWSGGGGQPDFINASQYFYQDGFLNDSVVPTGLALNQIGANYAPAGSLESSTFDTGGASNFTTLTWLPTGQHPSTELKFQLASNNDNTTWNFIGPDGTDASYYTTAGTNIHPSHSGDQYIRYKAFLATSNSSFTPTLTSVGLNYVAGCFTPGQTVFPDLDSGSNYDLEISLTGYHTYNESNVDIFGNVVHEILMIPQ